MEPAREKTPGVERTSKAGNLRGHSGEQLQVGAVRQEFPKSFHVTGTSAMYVNNPLDSENIVVGLMHLDSDELGNDYDMRTVFTNKAAGMRTMQNNLDYHFTSMLGSNMTTEFMRSTEASPPGVTRSAPPKQCPLINGFILP